MQSKGKTDKELWSALDGLEDDLLDPNFPEALVEVEIRRLGLSPEALANRGSEFVAQVREQERLSWQARALEKRAQLEARVLRVKVPSNMSRQAALDRINELRASDSKVGAAIRLAARKRKPEESTDEELRDLLEEMEMLRAIEDGEED